MSDNYWDNYWRERRSRRRFLGGAVAAGAGASALALVGCGDDDDDDDGGASPTSLATATAAPNATATPNDPLAGAKKGGTYTTYSTGDPPTLDPYGNISFLTKGWSAYFYSRLFMYKAGPGIAYGSVRPTPDAAESAEASPDGTKWTIKLKPNVKFHDIAPVSGRLMTTEDIKATYDRASSKESTNKPQASAPIDKVEYPDDKTIVFTLSKPSAIFLDVLADSNIFWLLPKEAFSGGFDPAKTAIGSGPWVLKDYTPSTKISALRHPSWHVGAKSGAPFFDGVDTAIIPEYANRLAQFRAGNLDACDINSDDLPDTIKQISGAKINARSGPTLSFTYFDPNPASPWNKDPRVRQAISMSYDRDSLLELGYNIKKLRDAGLKVDTFWHNVIPSGETAWWIDPQGTKQGESAKYFKYNPTDAKALLSAAGFEGLEATYQYTANRYGKSFNDIAEANIAYQTAIGIKTTTDVQDYSSKYITQTFLGNFNGIAFGYETPFPEAGSYLTRFFTDNPTNHSKVNDPELKKLAEDCATEVDEEKRKEIFAQAQIKNAEKMWYIPNVAGSGTSFTAAQPNITNYDTYSTKAYGGPTEVFPFYWKA
ncbi:MAG: ABC transporter substrate-binding protein [Dehalococcoidia bacterium]